MAIEDYVKELTKQIQHVNVCDQLQLLVDQAMGFIQGQIDWIVSEIGELSGQLTIPHDLKSVIEWIIGEIEPKYKAVLALIERLIALEQLAQGLISAIHNAINSIENCQVSASLSVTIPSLNIPSLEELNRGYNPYGTVNDLINQTKNTVSQAKNIA